MVLASAVLTTSAASSSSTSCETSRSGTPCEIDGMPSRCWNQTCRAIPKPCASDKQELQSCDNRFGVCFSFLDKKQLHCINSTEIRSYRNYEACSGKSDGAKCTPSIVGGWSDGTIALFQEPPGVCKESVCFPEIMSKCLDKSVGDACEFVSVSDGFTYLGRGTCTINKASKLQTRYCNVSATEHMPALEPVAPVQVFDHHPNVSDPTNVKTADLCNIYEPGTPCTHISGAASRCHMEGTCAGKLKPCPAGAKPLDACGSGLDSGFCFQYLDEKQLSCVDASDVRAALKYDACVGKRDGDACDDLDYTSMKSVVAFYELPKGRCYRQVCQSESAQVCEFKKRRDVCTAKVLSKENIVNLTAQCQPTSSGLFCTDRLDTVASRMDVVSAAVPIPVEKLLVKAVNVPKKAEQAPSSGSPNESKPTSMSVKAITGAITLSLSAVAAMLI
ncbi:hypothetical protein PINS_up012771 [Pythium insidiosum]|nr:hypothetical protein PINS_up012771 [Pythium insidiosum]